MATGSRRGAARELQGAEWGRGVDSHRAFCRDDENVLKTGGGDGRRRCNAAEPHAKMGDFFGM